MSSNNTNTKYTGDFAGGMADTFRDLMGIQVRAAQSFMDRAVGFGQTWSDAVQGQVNEGMRLTQECVKFGWSVTESAKKVASEVTERAFRSPSV